MDWFVIQVQGQWLGCFDFYLGGLDVFGYLFQCVMFVVCDQCGEGGCDFVVEFGNQGEVQQVIVDVCVWIQYLFVFGLVIVVDFQCNEVFFLVEVGCVDLCLDWFDVVQL